jgi:predicted Zn-dependent protease
LGEEHVALRVHDTRAVLRLLGDAVTPLRVIAEARAGDVDTARKDLAGLGGANEVDVAVATAALDRAAHDDGAAIAAYRKALAAAGDDLGDPKYHWYAPIAEGLGATLLEAHAPADAERVFRAELARYPNDPHLEFGLAQALADQGKDDRAARAAYAAQWQGKRPLTVADLG